MGIFFHLILIVLFEAKLEICTQLHLEPKKDCQNQLCNAKVQCCTFEIKTSILDY